jgi:hypothetical protein
LSKDIQMIYNDEYFIRPQNSCGCIVV